MALMPGLQIDVSQQLKLTPQLQQSIKILQYSALEVQQTIEQTLQTNFMLELEDTLEEDGLTNPELDEETPADEETLAEVKLDEPTDLDDAFQSEYSWEDIYSDRINPPTQTSADDEYTAPENYTSAAEDLASHLAWQVNTYAWDNPLDKLIAEYLIDSIGEDGYLKTPLEDLYKQLVKAVGMKIPVKITDFQRVLEKVQTFEPVGIAARDLQECLVLQLLAQTPSRIQQLSLHLIRENFDWLTNHNHNRITRQYKLNDAELNQLLKHIQTLNPRPGRAYSQVEPDIVIPDLRLRRSSNGWLVELNKDSYPRVTINKAYLELASEITNSKQAKQIREQLSEAKNLIKSVQNRGETLLRVGKYIIEHQEDFFKLGEEAMQPLVLREVAEALDLHESTISRATSQKYIQTPRGTFELRYFFSTALSQDGAEEQSAVAIKAHIKNLVEQEDINKPLSDKRIMEMLEEEQDIYIARRTIAKYREAMGIPSSSERRKMGRLR